MLGLWAYGGRCPGNDNPLSQLLPCWPAISISPSFTLHLFACYQLLGIETPREESNANAEKEEEGKTVACCRIKLFKKENNKTYTIICPVGQRSARVQLPVQFPFYL